jgi:Spy/CpxP family protein refolding chaperone
MMRGYGGGPGARGGCDDERDYGRGPGMMRGYGGGPGAWGGGPGAWGGGRGMMRGYGGGPGVMREWGEGPGGPFSRLDLTPDQQEKIAGIHEDMRRKTWDTMGQLHAEQFKLRHLYAAEKPDPTAIADQQKKIDDLRLTMLKARVETANQMRAVLTNEQRERLREFGPRWMEGDGDD